MGVDLKQQCRQFFEEVYGKGNLAFLDQACDAGYVSHDPLTGDADAAQEKVLARGYREAFPDLKPTILACTVEGETAVVHWRMNGTHQGALMGVAPSGRRCSAEGITIQRYRAGKLAEAWTQWDALGLFRQLGQIPGVEALGSAARTRSESRPHA